MLMLATFSMLASTAYFMKEGTQMHISSEVKSRVDAYDVAFTLLNTNVIYKRIPKEIDYFSLIWRPCTITATITIDIPCPEQCYPEVILSMKLITTSISSLSRDATIIHYLERNVFINVCFIFGEWNVVEFVSWNVFSHAEIKKRLNLHICFLLGSVCMPIYSSYAMQLADPM